MLYCLPSTSLLHCNTNKPFCSPLLFPFSREKEEVFFIVSSSTKELRRTSLQMATRKRDIVPGKEKTGTSPSHAGTTQTSVRSHNNPSKTNSAAKIQDSTTASVRHVPSYLKPARRSATDVSKQPNPAPGRMASLNKTPSPSRTQKARVSPNPAVRSSSLSGKTVSPQKTVPDKKLKTTPVTDAGKRRTLYARPVASIVKKSSASTKKKDTESITSAAKEKIISCTPHEKVENPDISTVTELEMQPKDVGCPAAGAEEQPVQETKSGNPAIKEQINSTHEEVKSPRACSVSEPETQPKHEESLVAEAETQILESARENEKLPEDLVPEGRQEQITIEQLEGKSEDEDKIVNVVEPSTTAPEQEESSLDIKAEEPEDKVSAEEKELEVHTVNIEKNNSNISESVADNSSEETKEKGGDEGKEVVTAVNEKEEATNGNDANDSQEIEVAAEKKQKAESEGPKQKSFGKKDLALSNNVIEETASKLREQRKNKVRALAGAFETVISLQ